MTTNLTEAQAQAIVVPATLNDYKFEIVKVKEDYYLVMTNLVDEARSTRKGYLDEDVVEFVIDSRYGEYVRYSLNRLKLLFSDPEFVREVEL